MLAGLIFATEDADDAPALLAATLPFGGMTLFEYQARLLVGAGVTHILVAVTRVTPPLLGAVARVGKRGIAIDVVRSAQEAVGKIHPLARILVLADGLVTTDDVVDRMAGDGHEALLVTPDSLAGAVERVDADHVWAGVARMSAQRLSDVAALPAEYDFQSTLLRMIVQAKPDHVPLPAGAVRAGHGVERHAAQLASRSYAVLAALTERRNSWADRHVFTRFARLVLPRMVARSIPGALLPFGALLFSALALACIALGWSGAGVALSLPAIALLATGAALSALRGEERRIAAQERLIAVLAALVTLALALAQATPHALTLGVGVIAVQAIAERVPVRHIRRWWASPAAYPLILAPFAVAGQTTLGLALAALYALLSLSAAVESMRENP